MTQQPRCLYCRHPVAPEAKRCPNCGAVIPRQGDWPPPAANNVQPAPKKPGELLTIAAWLDVVLGIATAVVLYLLWGISIVAIPIMYAFLYKKYPIFARTLGWCYVIPLILLAGAFLVCAGSGVYHQLGG